MGRRKIEIQPIVEDRNRTVTFIKRKAGLFKKAHELSVLCKAEVSLIILGHNNTFYEYSSVNVPDLMRYYNEDDSLRHVIKHPSDFGDFQQRDHVTLNKNARRRNYSNQANAARAAAAANDVIKTDPSAAERPLKRQRTDTDAAPLLSTRPTLTVQPPVDHSATSSATSPMDMHPRAPATASTTPPLLSRSANPSVRTTPTAPHTMEALPSLSIATHQQTMVPHGLVSQIPQGIPVQFVPSSVAHLQMASLPQQPQQQPNPISAQMYQQQAHAQSYLAPQRYLSPVSAPQRPHMSEPNLSGMHSATPVGQDWYAHMQQQQQALPSGTPVYMAAGPGGMYQGEVVRVAYGPPMPTPASSVDIASLTPERRYTATSTVNSSTTNAYEKVILPSVRRGSNISASHGVAPPHAADTSSGALLPSSIPSIGVKHESPKSPGGLVSK